MKVDTLTVLAQVTLKTDSPDAVKLASMLLNGDRVAGLVDQFPWMPFIVVGVVEEGAASTFELRMVAKNK